MVRHDDEVQEAPGGLSASNPPAKSQSPAFGGPGGAATFRGTNLQTALATLVAAVGLAEQPHLLGEGFPTGVPRRLGAEQHWPIDDLVVWFDGAIAWIQSKRDLDRDDLRSAFKQFAGQARHGRGRAGHIEPLTDVDRFVLAYDDAPNWADAAIDVLDRLRDGTNIEEFTQGSGPAKDAYDILVEAARTADASLDEAGLRALLRHVYFYPTRLGTLGTLARAALGSVVRPEAVAQAEAVLCRQLDTIAERRSLRDVATLRSVLREAGCALLASPGVSADVDVLLRETARTLDVGAENSAIVAADETCVHLQRAVTMAALDALAAGNIVVAAPAGEGKSVVLRDAAERLRAADAQVVFLEADGEQLRVAHTLPQIFDGWEGPGYLFIDGFDSLRLGPAANSLRHLIERLRGSKWHVAIASRDYDIERDAALRKLFPAGPAIPEAFRDERFPRVAIVRVNSLDAPEITELRSQSAALDRLFATAPPALGALLTNPFNLSIAAALAGDVDLAGVHDRADLLGTWWDHRVATGSSDAESALRTIVQAMIARRSLTVSSSTLDAHAAARDALFSQGVLAHRGPDNALIGFRHAAIFDYAVERLLLCGKGAPTTLLAEDPDAFVFILPSLRAHFTVVFDRSPADFIAELDAVFAGGRGRATLLSILAQITAARLCHADDLTPLFDGDPTHRRILHHIVSAALYWSQRGTPMVGPSAPPYSDLALLVALHLPDYIHDAALLVDEASKGTPTDAQGVALAHAARLVIISHLQRPLSDPNLAWFALVSLSGFIRTIDHDPEPALPLLEQLLAPDRLARVGQHEVFPLTRDLNRLRNPRALEILYRSIFADVALPAGTTGPARPNVALNLVQDNKQILDMARSALAQRFAAFIDASPCEAVRALCAIVRASGRARHTSPFHVTIAGGRRELLADGSQMWEGSLYHDHDDWKLVTRAFEERLREQLDAGRLDLFAAALEVITDNGPDLLLWRILVRSAGRTAESTRALLPFIAQRAVLLQNDLENPIRDYLATGYPRLTSEERVPLDEAILSLHGNEPKERLREYRAQLVARYAAALPADVDTRLAPFRDRAPLAAMDDETRFGGSVHSFPLPNALSAAAPAALSAELAGAVDEAMAFMQQIGDGSAVVPLIRRLEHAIGEPTSAPPAALLAFVKLVYEGLRLKVLSDEELRAWTPLLLAAASFDLKSEEDADGYTGDRTAIEVAEAAASTLPFVYRQTEDARVAEAADKLAAHPDAFVRHTALQYVLVLGQSELERRWAIAERAVRDPSPFVAQMASWVFDQLITEDEARAWRGRLAVYDRFANDVVHDYTIHEIRRLIEWTLAGNHDAAARLDGTLDDPWANPELSKLVVFGLVTELGPPTSTARALVPRVVALVEHLHAQLREALASHGHDLAIFPEADRDRTNVSIQLLIEIAHRVQVHSGLTSDFAAFDDAGARDEHYGALLPIIEALATVRLPHTAYYVIRTLTEVIDIDPRAVLTLGTRAVLTGVSAGLAFDHFGQEEVRDFLLRYVADHRDVLEQDRVAFTGVMDILDAFADVGWPSWIDVAFALDAIYRD